jgi:hypothetical protein
MKINMDGNHQSSNCKLILTRAFLVAVFFICSAIGLAQLTPPVLTVAPSGTNQLNITITNGINLTRYEIWTTPVLGDVANYPWTVAAVGNTNQTNFTVDIGPYYTGFYRAVIDTNAVPLWKAADPNNPSAGVLSVWIDSPANGTTLN